MPYPKKTVIENTLKGISKSVKTYSAWSGWDDGYWLVDAPEYLITTYIANEIATYRRMKYYITLEQGTRAAMSDAGGMKQGQPRKDLRLNGRVDIVLWWADGSPRIVIEVKNHIYGYWQINKDVARICSVLDQNNSIRRGLAAFYTSDLKEKLSKRISRITERANMEVGDRSYTVHSHLGKPKPVGDRYWVPLVLEIAKR